MHRHTAAAPTNSDVGDIDLLYREHRQACLQLARSVVRDHQLAEDIVQDVFLMLWQTAGVAYQAERGRLGPFLRTVVHHRAVDTVRLTERRRRLEAQAAQPANTSSPSLVHDTTYAAWRAGELAAALRVLSPTQREVLALAYVAGLTQAQIAARVDIPLGTVKSRTFTGLLRLRAALARAGAE